MKIAFSVGLDIAAEPSRVFAYIGGARRHLEWQKGLVSVSADKPLELGMTYISVSQVLGHKMQVTNVVADIVPDRHLTVTNRSGLLAYTITYKLVQAGHSTQLECHCEVESQHPLFEMAGSLAEGMARDRIEQDLGHLKELVERPVV